MRNLFHRRTNERRQTFPFRLANDAQAAAKIARFIHYQIARKGTANFLKRMIEREIIRDHFASHPTEK